MASNLKGMASNRIAREARRIQVVLAPGAEVGAEENEGVPATGRRDGGTDENKDELEAPPAFNQ